MYNLVGGSATWGKVRGSSLGKKVEEWRRTRRRRRDRKEGEEDLKDPEVLVVETGTAPRALGQISRV